MSQFPATPEQDGIFSAIASGKNLVVVAYAGTGKSTTLLENSRRDTREALYLVYNAANRKEAAQRFPRHVKPATGHSLAFKPIIANNRDYRAKFEAARNGTRIQPWDIAASLSGANPDGLEGNRMAGAVLRTIAVFQNSAERTVEIQHVPDDALPPKIRTSTDPNVVADAKEAVWRNTQRIWERMANSSDPFPILHDTYLKLFQLSDPRLREGVIYCDEFQDTTPVMVNIIDQQDHAQTIMIGDKYQQIYGWRGAINALDNQIKRGTDTRHLSVSFRFGNQVAGLANILLATRGETVPLRGAGAPAVKFDENLPRTVIARNNMTLFEHAVIAIETKSPFTIVGGSRDIANLIESGYALYRGNTHHIRDPDLKGYDSWDQFKEIIELTQDATMGRLAKLIEKYKAQSLDFIEDLKEADSRPEDQSQIILTTAHKSKGREWSQTELCEDLSLGDELLLKAAQGEHLTPEENEKFNLLYVAATRCEHGLKLAPDVRMDFKFLREALRERQAQQEADEPKVAMSAG